MAFRCHVRYSANARCRGRVTRAARCSERRNRVEPVCWRKRAPKWEAKRLPYKGGRVPSWGGYHPPAEHRSLPCVIQRAAAPPWNLPKRRSVISPPKRPKTRATSNDVALVFFLPVTWMKALAIACAIFGRRQTAICAVILPRPAQGSSAPTGRRAA